MVTRVTWKAGEMKSKALVFLLAALVFSLPYKALSDTPRPIASTQIYNNLLSITNPGRLFIPTATPFGNRACFFDNDSTLASSVTTATELSFLHGVTSNVQTQINEIIAGGVSRTVYTTSLSLVIANLARDYLLNADSTLSILYETLPDAVASNGFCIDIKNIGSPANVVTVLTQFSQTIDGQSSYLVSGTFESARICANGSNWFLY